MKNPTLFLSALGLGVLLGVVVEDRRHATQHELQRSAWESEKARLIASLDRSNIKRDSSTRSTAELVRAAPDSTAAPSAQTLLNQLANLPFTEGESRSTRQMLVTLEQITGIGPSALPAIRQFLISGSDVTYASPGGKGRRNVKSLVSALVPASLRLALFDTVHQIGGKDAEAILVDALGRTRSGLEVACLTEFLEQMAPGLYKDAAVSAAGNLLAAGVTSDREMLFDVMKRFDDTSYMASAQKQVIQSDGQVDRAALRYLQQTLGPESMALIARSYRDARLSEPGSKEPLARAALAYVGSNEQALDLFHTALLDESLLPDQRRNLVEDLNEDGLNNRRNPTPEDLHIIANRYALTQSYLKQDYVQNDKMLSEAFHEADKDLRNMLDKAATVSSPAK